MTPSRQRSPAPILPPARFTWLPAIFGAGLSFLVDIVLAPEHLVALLFWAIPESLKP